MFFAFYYTTLYTTPTSHVYHTTLWAAHAASKKYSGPGGPSTRLECRRHLAFMFLT